MTALHFVSSLSILMALSLGVGCGGAASTEPPAHAGEAPDEHDAHAEPADEHAHGEGEEEASDLDRSVEELFSLTCEHNIPTHACDECRYEVGVVKVAPHLLEGGLIQTARAENRPVASPLPLTGEVAYDERRIVEVGTQADGVLRQVQVTLGDVVTRGQALAVVESIEVGEAQASYLEARGLLDLAQRNLDRLTALHDQGISAERELLVARQEQESARIRMEAAVGRLTRLGVEARSLANLTPATADGRFVLRAPQAGTVLELHAVPGETVRPETALATIGDGSAVWVWADLYERDVLAVQEAQARGPLAASVTIKSRPGEEYTGVVDYVRPVMDRDTRTARVRVVLDNPRGELLAGMFVGVTVYLPGPEEAVSIPRKAVMQDEGRSFVFVHREGDFWIRRPVEMGRASGAWSEIRAGLEAGAEVAANGAFLLKSDVLRSKMGAGCAD